MRKKTYRYKDKTFKTKSAKKRYQSWNPIIKKLRKQKAPKSTIKMMKNFQKSWIGSKIMFMSEKGFSRIKSGGVCNGSR